jgi:cytochrome c oxidase assembly factor CtaG
LAITLILALISFAYLRGFLRHTRPLAPLIAMAGAVGVVEVALASPLAGLSHHLMAAHMLQHVLLMLFAAPLLVWARPVPYLLHSLPLPMRRRVTLLGNRLGARRLMRSLTAPALAWVLFCGAVLVWHIPALYHRAMERPSCHWLMEANFLGAALLFWLAVLEPAPRHRLSYASGSLYVFSAALLTGLPGALIAFARQPLYVDAVHAPAPFGFTALADQQLAGLIMWIPMDLILFAVALALMAAAFKVSSGLTASGSIPLGAPAGTNHIDLQHR